MSVPMPFAYPVQSTDNPLSEALRNSSLIMGGKIYRTRTTAPAARTAAPTPASQRPAAPVNDGDAGAVGVVMVELPVGAAKPDEAVPDWAAATAAKAARMMAENCILRLVG